VIRFELKARLAADRAAWAVAVVAVMVAGWVSARYLSLASTGAIAALIAGCLVLAGIGHRQVPRRLEALAEGRWRLEDAASRGRAAVCGPATRILGSTLVLDLRAAGQARRSPSRLWLTPADLPGDTLRRLRVRLVARGPADAS
jgi:hypothetical protein